MDKQKNRSMQQRYEFYGRFWIKKRIERDIIRKENTREELSKIPEQIE